MDIKFDYKIIRSDRRTLCIQITPDGTVTVRVPRRASDRDVTDFILDKSAWVEKHLASLPPVRTEAVDEAALREKAKRDIPPRVEYWSKIMGLRPSGVRITSAKKRFGSCSSKNSLCFSLYLAEYPPEAVDYVIVHELAHIKHKNHSPAFHALVGKYLPDQEARKRLLRGK